MWHLDLGATPLDATTVRFRVWAPYAKTVAIDSVDTGRSPIALLPQPLGYHEATVDGIGAGSLYRYVLDGSRARPDPASRSQPQGVHGPSAVVSPESFPWSDSEWPGCRMDELIIYELHVGTFTSEGTFHGIISKLEYLRHELGVTAIELMPIAQFPGSRNWGYDGVCLFAPHAAYGGVEGFKALVDACHAIGLAVILDVVYNHVGPEGNYLDDFGPYFTDQYQTPWGRAINYDRDHSDEVRHFVISNALYWVTEYHLDGLRLDAIHGIYDFSARHVLQDLAHAVHAEADRLGRSILVIGESDLNDARVIAPEADGGHGLDGQWSDDCHHALHTALTGERAGYYEDFGRLEQVATALTEGFVYSGQRSPHRQRRHGNSARDRSPSQLVVFSQNHDQIGNRALGDRLGTLVPRRALTVAAATILLAPQTPLLFMGEEYGETAPFLYFIDHGDPALVEAVRTGRKKEFAAFGWNEVPDPQSIATFERSRLAPRIPENREQAAMFQWYRGLIQMRKTVPALGSAAAGTHRIRTWTDSERRVLIVHRWTHTGDAALLLLGFSEKSTEITLQEPLGIWDVRVDSERAPFGGAEETGPRTLEIPREGVSVELPGYGVVVYVLKRG